MADRQDPSQYAFTAGPADGFAALPSTDITNDQLQRSPDADYAQGPEMLEMVSQPDFADVPDLIHEKPGRFYTQGPRKTRAIASYRPVPSASGFLIPGGFRLAGFSFRETTGTTAAALRLRDGYDVGAPIVVTLALAPAESTRDWLPTGLKFRYGLYAEIVSGTIEGTVFTLEAEDVQ